ncbi:MAG TPA: hypothetical protein VG711_01975 [Phycisphaerales bacterium]|nr:hypothetical protein [Phycisphaerales bacterium]
MHCKNCDYPLWNIAARKCPECGTDFLPSQFEFRPNTVKFCCPHCNQQYFGTDPHGLLSPRSFVCVNCHQPVSMDQMVLRPADGVTEAQTIVSANPWLERARRGKFKAWFAAIGQTLITPGKLMSATPVNSSTGQAWWFWIVTQTITMIVAFSPLACLCAIPAMSGSGTRGGLAVGQIISITAGFVFGSLIALFFFTLIWGVATHGLLRLTGPTLGSFGRTYQTVCYASGANVMTAVPCIGQYVGVIWWIVSATIATVQGQRVTGGRAAFAVITPPIVMIALVFAAYISLVVLSMPSTSYRTTTGVSGSSISYSNSSGVASMAQAVSTYASYHNNQIPRHALYLVTNSNIEPDEFVSDDTSTSFNTIPVADTTLDRFAMANYSSRQAIARKAADSLPANVLAYRLGDYIFLDPGATVSNVDSSLWTVIFSPDPDSANMPASTFEVGTFGGGQLSYDSSPFRLKTVIESQNMTRRRCGLPPLPTDVSLIQSVTHAKPLAISAAQSGNADSSDSETDDQ